MGGRDAESVARRVLMVKNSPSRDVRRSLESDTVLSPPRRVGPPSQAPELALELLRNKMQSQLSELNGGCTLHASRGGAFVFLNK